MADATHASSSRSLSRASPVIRRPPKNRKSNYSHVHRHALPIQTYPLPTLIPHNPLSVIAIALSYLTRLIAPPKQPMHKGYFSTATGSIHITDEESIRALWEMGFFGKGSLSRSEPTWLQSQRKKGSTSEEATDQRRKERRERKLERAKKEKETIDGKLREEQQSNESSIDNTLLASQSTDEEAESFIRRPDTPPHVSTEKQNGHSNILDHWKHTAVENHPPTPPSTSSSGSTPSSRQTAPRTCSDGRVKTVRFSPTIEAREFDLSSPTTSPIKSPGATAELDKHSFTRPSEVKNQEHLQLLLEEAFFLSYALGILEIYLDFSDVKLSPTSLLPLFQKYSPSLSEPTSPPPELNNSFLTSYAAYHYFRSHGWVIRSGVKFSVDYLLYNRGPVFSHADFAVVIVPSYTHNYWSATQERAAAVQRKTAKSWWWLHCISRVQAQVQKTLVLCYVDVPPPQEGNGLDIGGLLEGYKVRTVTVKRWTPNRDRD